jgi:hypothetical protein
MCCWKKNKNLYPNHLYCHLMYIPYTTFRHSFHHCGGTCHSGAPVFVSYIVRRMMPPSLQTTFLLWPRYRRGICGKCRESDEMVLLNLLFHCTHQILINHRWSAAPRIIMHIFTSFIKESHTSPYHWITHGMFSIHLTKLTKNVSQFRVSCIQ